jgi:integrase/recombinase XerD
MAGKAMNTLRRALGEYLGMRRNLGFKLQRVGPRLLDFVAFLERRHASFITVELALAWAKMPEEAEAATWAQRLSYVRLFARYRRAVDPRTEVPPPSLMPYRPTRARPYLYSDSEIGQLLRAARKLPRIGLRPLTYYCFLGLLSVSGLRVGEAQNLELRDVDLKQKILTIRGAKFGKDRLVPLHPSTVRVLARYIAQRQSKWREHTVAPYLFLSSLGNRLDGGDIRKTFHKLSRQIGIRGASDHRGPRLHDFRHRFASNSLLRWYKTGKDPEQQLPLLATYLGHVGWANTYWYLSAQPALMKEAMSRLENRWQ